MDGASTWTTYWKIIFPLMKPMHATVAVITGLAVWNDVMTPLVIMGGSGVNTLPLAQMNFQTAFATNYNLAFASYLLAMLPMIIFYIVAQKQIIGGVTNGAVKWRSQIRSLHAARPQLQEAAGALCVGQKKPGCEPHG